MRGGAVRLKNLGTRRAAQYGEVRRPTQKKSERDAEKTRLGEKARAESRRQTRAQAVKGRQDGDADEKVCRAQIFARAGRQRSMPCSRSLPVYWSMNLRTTSL